MSHCSANDILPRDVVREPVTATHISFKSSTGRYTSLPISANFLLISFIPSSRTFSVSSSA
eukprot:Skav219564  [mRNA]  locus=scaffold886:83969:86231:+ [translate_table: standard]